MIISRWVDHFSGGIPIANSRLVALDKTHVAFTWKDYRSGGATKVMRLKADEFIRRFLLHVLPDGFHRIRSFGFMANGHRTANLALCRSLIEGRDEGITAQATPTPAPGTAGKAAAIPACPHCGGVMRIVGGMPRGVHRPGPRAPPFAGVAT